MIRFRTALVILLLHLVAVAHCLAQKQSQILKIGVIAPLSGAAQLYGTALKNGIDLALKDLPEPRIKVLYEDDGFVVARTVAAFKKLTEIDRVDVVISTASQPSNAIAALAEEKQIPLIAWASDQKVSENRKFVVRSWMSGFAEGARIADEAMRRGYNKIGLVASINDYPLSVKQGVVATLSRSLLAFEEELPAEVADFKSTLTKARGADIDLFVVCLNPGQTGLFAKQAKALGFDAQFGGCENMFSRDEVQASQNALLGSWLVTATASPTFRERYIKSFGDDSVVSGAAIHYDVISALNFIAAQGVERSSIIDALIGLHERDGAIGRYEVKRERGDQYFRINLGVKIITESGFEDLG